MDRGGTWNFGAFRSIHYALVQQSCRELANLTSKMGAYRQQYSTKPIRAVCSRALSETIVGTARTSLAKVCIRLPEGPYLTSQASKLTGPSASVQLAVWFEPAKPSDTLPLFSEAIYPSHFK
nr:hypothetical protein [Brevibacillus laterosporus]